MPSGYSMELLDYKLRRKPFLKGSKMEKTSNLSQKCQKMAFRNFCHFDRNQIKTILQSI